MGTVAGKSDSRLAFDCFCIRVDVSSQALWLQQGYQLEFLGNSTFVPGLWAGGVLFFLTNIWILGIIISDAGTTGETAKGGQAQMILK